MSENQLSKLMEEKLGINWITFLESKSGATWYGKPLKFDLLALRSSWSKPCIRIYEAKVTRSCFLNDEKWVNYLDHCNEFYWIAPLGLIKTEEIDKRCGLVTVNPKTDSISVRKKAVFRDMNPANKADVLMYLFMWRLNVKEIGVPREEKMAQIRKEIDENRELGIRYNRFISKNLQAASYKYEAKYEEIKKKERDLEIFEDWCKKMEMQPWDTRRAISKHQILEAMRTTIPAHMLNDIQKILRNMDILRDELSSLLEYFTNNEERI